MMAEFRHTIESLLSPLFISLVLITLSLYCCWQVGCARRLLLAALFLLFCFSTYFVPAWLTRRLESTYLPLTNYDHTIRYVVVLSGGQSDVNDQAADMVLNSASIKRTVTGIRIWRQLPDAKLVLSGGGYGHQTPEAVYMQQLAINGGVPAAKILVEADSENTQDQARQLRHDLSDQPFYLVTSAIHMPRSMRLFEEQGLKPIAAPTDFTDYWQDERWQKRYIPNSHNLMFTHIAMHEYLGILYRNLIRLFQRHS